MLFSSFTNKLAHKIKKLSGFTWGQALRLAMQSATQDTNLTDAATGVFGEWTPATQRALAGHFYALKMLSKEAGDEGRAFAFGRVSNSLFACWENHGRISWNDTYHFTGWGDSIRSEILDFFLSATTDPNWVDHTDRVMKLLVATNQPHHRVHLPRWTF